MAEVLIERCVEVGAQVAREGAEFGVRDRELAVGGQRIVLQGLSGTYDDIFLPLHGEHQASNAALALAAAEALVGAGPRSPLDPDAVRAAFAAVRSPGRLERVAAGADVATVLVDAAHNPHGARALAAALTTEFRFTRLIAVVAAMRDKDVRGILAELEPVVAEIVVTANSSPRTMDPDELGALAVSVFGSERVSVEPVLAAGDRAGPRAGRGGGHLRGRRHRHRLGGHGGGGAAAVRSGAGMTSRRVTQTGARPVPEIPDPTKGLRGVYAAVLVLEAIVVGLALLVLPKFGAGRRRSGSG